MIAPPLTLVSLNIEGARHWDLVLPFLKDVDADVVCIQELFEHERTYIEALGYHSTYLRMAMNDIRNDVIHSGVGIFSKAPSKESNYYYYHRPTPNFRPYSKENLQHTVHRGVLTAAIPHGEEVFHIATTHFTWTPDGLPNTHQRQTFAALMSVVKTLEPHVICGDFNVPRHHNELYEKIIEVYTDEVPASYTSSLDKNIHRVSGSPSHAHLFTDYMVDYVFTQPPYKGSDTNLVFDVSDHAAVITHITKT